MHGTMVVGLLCFCRLGGLIGWVKAEEKEGMGGVGEGRRLGFGCHSCAGPCRASGCGWLMVRQEVTCSRDGWCKDSGGAR